MKKNFFGKIRLALIRFIAGSDTVIVNADLDRDAPAAIVLPPFRRVYVYGSEIRGWTTSVYGPSDAKGGIIQDNYFVVARAK